MSEQAKQATTEQRTEPLRVRVAKALGWELARIPVSSSWSILDPHGNRLRTVAYGDDEDSAWGSAVSALPAWETDLNAAFDGPVAFARARMWDVVIKPGQFAGHVIVRGYSRMADGVGAEATARAICEALLAAVDATTKSAIHGEKGGS